MNKNRLRKYLLLAVLIFLIITFPKDLSKNISSIIFTNETIVEMPEDPIERQLIIGKEDEKPENLDFSIFWEVWNKIEKEHIDLKEKDLRKQMLEGAIKGMINAIGDEHTQFLNKEDAEIFMQNMEEEFEGIGMQISIDNGYLTVVAPLNDTPADRAGIKAGDKIIKINGELTKGITLPKAVTLIRGPKGKEVHLTIIRDKKEIKKTIIRGIIVIPTASLSFIEYNSIAHIKVFTFNSGTIEQLNDIAKKINNSIATKIILDLRNNPGGLLNSSVDVAGLFLERNSIVVIQQKRNREITSRTKRFHRPLLKNYDLVVLINKGSASASEILAGALRDNREIILIGEQSFGKGSVQELKKIDDSILKITVSSWFTPNRHKIEGQGLVPDVFVKLDKNKLINNIDTQVQKAIEILKN